jgi:hypothetical protein
MDPYEIVFVDLVDDVHNFFEGQQWKWFSMGSGGSDFGLFHYDLINIKLETYGNGAICNSGTSNIAPLLLGVEVGPNSDITYPGPWYPNQLDLSNPGYTQWNGLTAYAGIQFEKNGNNHYGWIRLRVSDDGKHYYALDMAYNEAPEQAINTGEVESPTLAYSQTVFHESVSNDGAVESERIIEIFGATWADFGIINEGNGFSISEIPTGISAQLERVTDTQLILSFIGNANAHNNSEDSNYMDFSIDGSLINESSSGMSLSQQISIDFSDPYAIEYVNISESEIISVANPGNAWKWFTLDVGDADYGLWYVDEYFRLETYAKSGVCNAGTTDLAVLQDGDVISDLSYWDYFTELETQLVITSPDYSSWNGETAYVGIKFTIADRFHYGWMQLEVSAAGDVVTLIDYAYNINPGEEIIAGQIYATYGCTDSEALNFNPNAIDDDGTCLYPLDCGDNVTISVNTYDSYGDGWNNNYLEILNSIGDLQQSITLNNGSEGFIEFCLEQGCYTYSAGGGNYLNEISWDLYQEAILLVSGEGGDSGILSINSDCDYLYGCTDVLAYNYNPDAIVEDGSCTYPELGCTDPLALNYNPDAEVDDSSCYYEEDVLGCTDEVALNYNVYATYDDGSCIYPSLSLDPVSTELCLGESILISWTGGNPNGAINIGLINVTTSTSLGSIDIVDNTGEYLWVIEDVMAGTGVVYKFYIQDDPWPPTSWSYGSEFTISDDCAPTCPEDLNSDGYITTQDLLLILSEFGCTSSCEYDITQDNYVAVDDVLQILSGFGNVCE